MKPVFLIVTTVNNTFRTLLADQVRFLAQHFDVHLACTDDGNMTAFALDNGASFHHVPMSRGISPMRDIQAVRAMRNVIADVSPDIVQSFTPKAGLVAMFAAWTRRVPVRVHTFTGLIFPSRSGMPRQLLLNSDRATCGFATHVVPESQGVADQLREASVTNKPLELIGKGNIIGVDTNRMRPDAAGVAGAAAALRAELGMASDDTAFAFVGRLNRDKGIPELLSAFSRLPENAHLLIAGRHDETAPIGVTERNTIETHPRIHHLGFQADIRGVYAACDALVLPSYREGFPNVLLEAAALARPVISTRVNGAAEFIETRENGWLVPIRDSDALHRAMVELSTMLPQDRDLMGICGREKVTQHYARDRHHSRLLKYYQTRLLEAGA